MGSDLREDPPSHMLKAEKGRAFLPEWKLLNIES